MIRTAMVIILLLICLSIPQTTTAQRASSTPTRAPREEIVQPKKDPEPKRDLQPEEDVVRLKNGTIVRGIIIELVPTQLLLKIKTRDGSLFVYDIADILSVSIGQKGLIVSGNKDPWIAFGLSVPLPGGGQIYNGQYGKAAVLFTGTMIGLLLLTRNSEGDLIGGSDEDYEAIQADLNDFSAGDIPFVLGGVLCVGGYLYQLIDAPKSANRINQGGWQLSHRHLIEFDGGRTAVGINPLVLPNRFGTELTFRW